MKQNQGHSRIDLVIAKAGEEGWIENLGLANSICEMDKQQGPAV